jgi:hypothetical protein
MRATGLFGLHLLLSLLLSAPSSGSAEEFQVQSTDQGLTIKQDGKLVTNYLVKSGAKPILWPLIGPGGKEMTRGYPMREVGPLEKADHVHHRSFWFTHGDVNGHSFWHENENHGEIVHRAFKVTRGGETAVITSVNDWMADGRRQCSDERTITIGGDFDRRWIDFDITLSAPDRDAVFGDTKEGMFGVRVAGSMRVELDKGGRIVNSNGLTDTEAWGKPAAWVDYSGPVDGQRLGIAILNHPSSFRFPTYWHVRTYGLFAANPFGLHDFKRSNDEDGSYRIQKGESIRFRYRVLIHRGDADEGRVAEEFDRYAKQ